MALIDDVKTVCDRLAPLGWRDLLRAVTAEQLDIAAPGAAELSGRLRDRLERIDRTQPGFEDFSPAGVAAITPLAPARSLLYHALAGPGVLNDHQGVPLRGFPTPREIEIVENYVFGVEPPSLAELATRTGGPLSVVVFSYEYRPAPDTCSRRQADLAFSRTGVARVGTLPARYDGARRGFWVEAREDAFGIRVCPARYAAFLSVRRRGSRAGFLPMRFQEPSALNSAGDAGLDFWVPVHKLFDGGECLRGLDLRVTLSARHANDKIRRIQVALGNAAAPATFPFQFTSGIAELSTDPEMGSGLLVPVVHPRLVEPARRDGQFVTFDVPRNNGTFFGALELTPGSSPFGEVRPAPAYVHARSAVRNGTVHDLGNDPGRPDVLNVVDGGGYEALHYVDFTGDGEVACHCPQLVGAAGVAPGDLPAYSLVAAPDFFPSCGQRELTEWANSRAVPTSLQREVWKVDPRPLCDTRLPANLQLPAARFDRSERTMTAIVPLFGPPPAATLEPKSADATRHGALPDDAAGVFAPGWDVSHDLHVLDGQQVFHLAAYGLGSPFPEDAKLCAALSTFWPSVAPDVARGLEPNPNPSLRVTVAPLTDEEIGQTGTLPWDGIPGPKLVTVGGQAFAECESFFHADYVETALAGRFTLQWTSRVTAAEYQRRVLAMALAHRVLGDRDRWFVLSFTRLSGGDAELQQAENDANAALAGDVYRFDVFQVDPEAPSLPAPGAFRRRLLPIVDRRFLLVSPADRQALVRRADQPRWRGAVLSG